MAANVRISQWAKWAGIQVTPFDAVSKPPAGSVIYRVKDIFTTRDGSWDVSTKRGSIEQWARDAYLSKAFDDAGADHHLFGRVETGGTFNSTARIHFWTYRDDGNHTRQPVKVHSGWGNIPMFASSSFVPERGERGPWAWSPVSAYADIVTGGGMPAKEHWSFFAVWTTEVYAGTTTPDKPTDPPTSDIAKQVADHERRLKRIEKLLNSWQGD